MATSVVDPDGRRWTVRRRWVPRLGAESVWGRFHRRFRQTMRRAGDVADADAGFLDVIGEGVVAARSEDGPRLLWRVVGWRASGQQVAEVAQLLAAGVAPADASEG